MITQARGRARLDPASLVQQRLPALRTPPWNRVLVPLVRGQSAASLLSIGDAIAGDCQSRGVVLSLVEIPSRWSGMVTSAVVRSRDLLRWIAATDYEADCRSDRLSIQSRFTSDPAASIREALLETQCDTVLAEFPHADAPRRHRLERILRELSNAVQVNLVVARPDPAANGKATRPKSVLVPLRGGANAWLALGVGRALASWSQARLTLLHVYNPDHHHALREHERSVFHELKSSAAAAASEVLEVVNQDVASAILGVAADHDAVVLGAHSNPSRAGILAGPMLSSVINRLDKTVILTRAAADLRPAA